LGKENKATLLIVEDEEGARKAVARILESMGYEVEEASNSDEALDMVKGGRAFDILISDLSLPGMDGWELAKAVGKLRPEIKIGILTGWEITEDDERIAESGISEILSKPVDMHKMKLAIDRMLARKTG